jgi:hypothetical protein
MCVLVLTGCGVQENNSEADAGKSGRYALTVDTPADRPPCTQAEERQLIYVIETSQFEVCAPGGWEVIDIAGKDGKQGQVGSRGGSGPKGDAGQDGVAGPAGAIGPAGPAGAPGADAPNIYTDMRRIKNTLATIKVGDTLLTMLPEARDYLLTLGRYSSETVNSRFMEFYDINCGKSFADYRIRLDNYVAVSIMNDCQ